ncbi:hypothetical protein K450DRAFT_227893 [Umbelopsis ramanniana AG]|uniref:Uncharacterized protein n=1 Tax=Umbelopsis ramanniana AG TaxID=1314678 RepID=A0AAD5EH74_UMBRA|nr:uncharacterized protein K450DRAFT_227893 [Umbelopsis ramanniana AG]KAI8582205.1 hypothetical protein K450DRAFT_227893 [Umbelopsis ramanniana AG]
MSVELQIKRKKSLTLKKKNKVAKTVLFHTSYPHTTDIVDSNDQSLTLSGEATVGSPEEQSKFLMDHSNDIVSSSSVTNIQQESNPAFEESKCPMCDKSLAGTTRLQKLDHANKCLDVDATPIPDAEKLHLHTNTVADHLDFQACIFCGKDMLTYNFQRREQHANRCLDEIVAEQSVIELSKITAERYNIDNSYGNTAIPMKYNVDICPCCREDWTHRTLSLRSKMLHMKSCANGKGVSIQELGRRLQWTNWGLSSRQTRQNPLVEDKPAELPPPNSIKDASKTKEDPFVLCTSDDEDFQSLSVAPTKPISTTLKKNTKRKKTESMDEDLRIAIALSKSLMKAEKKLKSKKGRRITEEDRNSSSVLSIEESKSMVMKNLETLLCTPCIKKLKPSLSTPSLPASKLASLNNKVDEQELENGRLPLWILASSMEANHQKYITPLLANFLK